MDAGLVGLKNAGATCYMNSVLQQLYIQPHIAQSVLAIETEEPNESLLSQLQRVFGHLMESEVQYFTPKGFWDVFRLWGQPINPREQQDAFEFYTTLIDALDEDLKVTNFKPLF